MSDSRLASPVEPSWRSLRTHRTPEWFRDAKFGIWSHWGPQSVPMLGDWISRHMYGPDPTMPQRAERARRGMQAMRERYGHQSEFGHKDVCNLWRAELWDPEDLMDLYCRAGARYFVSMAVHCDNFDLWDSAHQPWNAVRVGPKTDVVGRWAQAARARGLPFGASVHAGSWTWNWYIQAYGSDSSGSYAGVPYDGRLTRADGQGMWWDGLDPADLYVHPHAFSDPPDPSFIENFYARVDDLVDKYRPEMVYFDDYRLPFDEGSVTPAKPPSQAGLDFVARYYNRSAQWNTGTCQAMATIKRVPDADRDAILLDIERGHVAIGQQWAWQCDTTLGDWFYDAEEWRWPKPARQIIHMLADTIAKNGTLLLNVPQRPDGTIDDTSRTTLEEIGAWLDVAGEAIYATRPWTAFGEGSTLSPEGHLSEQDITYTPDDIRFTTKGDTLYAILLAWPDDGLARIRSLSTQSKLYPQDPQQIDLLGGPHQLRWQRDEHSLTVELPQHPPCQHAFALRIRRR